MINAVALARALDEPPTTDAAWWQSIPWLTVLIIAVVIVVIALLIWAIVIWRRKRAAAAAPRPVGSSAGDRLRALWEPFYRELPARALHYPTVVVMGEAGVGKSHAIATRVDWRGQTKQYQASVDHGAAMQLYLGPDVVVHELSAAVLRDVGPELKRSLHGLWRHMGPSATVLLVLDARSLLTTTPQALRELAQLVRGKISLFPARCRETLQLRIYLSHLDRIEGYEVFAASLGQDHPGLALESGDAKQEATRLLAAFDGHLAHALTARSGLEFDRMVQFYAELPQLIAGLGPLLDALSGTGEPFAERYTVSDLYLGAALPHSHVGDPFVVDRSQISVSVDRQHRRGLIGSAAMAASLAGVLLGLFGWHGRRVAAAEHAVARFEAVQDRQADVSEAETRAANDVTDAVEAMYASEILWFAASFRPDKRDIDGSFEQAIRHAYLEPDLDNPDRLALLYVTSLIYASRDNELGKLIRENRVMWADELGLSEWVIDAYVQSSHEPYDRPVTLPATIEQTGREWTLYLRQLDTSLRDGLLDGQEVEQLQRDLPRLRGPREYQVLSEVRELLRDDDNLYDRLAPLLSGSFDSWAGTNHAALESLSQVIRELDLRPGKIDGWGLARLIRGLDEIAGVAAAPYVLDTQDVHIDSEALMAVILRSRRHELIEAVLGQLEARPRAGGRAFFDQGARPVDAGLVRGYGGGPTRAIPGVYTKDAFDGQVAPVLRFAEQLAGVSTATVAEAEPPPTSEATPEVAAPAAPTAIDLFPTDKARLERMILAANTAYAGAYRRALDEYWNSFTFAPGSEIALPYVLEPFAAPNTWVSEFLLTAAHHANLGLPPADADPAKIYEPLREALADYGPLLTLLAEDKGTVPGLAPYQGLMAKLQQRVAEAAAISGDPDGEELILRLSGLGALALGISLGTEDDYAELVSEWLFGAGIDSDFWTPFMAPVQAVRNYGRADIRQKVATAWIYDVRPVVEPLLDKYPFSPASNEDAGIAELETIARKQGELPGTFWEAFDRLIRPAMADDRLAMLVGVEPPPGMLAMVRDLERLSSTLWDEKGEPLPLKVELRIEPLPIGAVDGRVATMASIGSGGGSVFGFNNRPDRQVLEIDWWSQGSSVVSLTMSTPVSEQDVLAGGAKPDERKFRSFASGEFSFFRLLDQAASPDLGNREDPITVVAMQRATRCSRQGPSGTKGVTLSWGLLVGADVREVSVVVLSDPWSVFAVRNCR